MEGRYLITTDARFFGPDGRNDYRAAYGDVKIIDDSVLGVKTNRNSSNWFAMVGTEEEHIIIAGCQIHYAIKCNELPEYQGVKDYVVHGGDIKEYLRPTEIWMPKSYKPTVLDIDTLTW